VAYRATIGSLVRGVAGGVVYWGAAAVAIAFVLRALRRGDRWLWILNHRAFSILPAAAYGAALWLVWALFIQYWTNLTPSLQLWFGIGVPGEMAIAILPPVLLVGYTVREAARGESAYLEAHPEARIRITDEEIRSFGRRLASAGRMRRVLVASAVQYAAMYIAFLFLAFDGADLPATFSEGLLLVLAVATPSAAVALRDRLLVWANDALPSSPALDNALSSELEKFGLSGQRVNLSVNPALSIAGTGRRRPTVGAACGRRVVVIWGPLIQLPVQILAPLTADAMEPLFAVVGSMFAVGAAAIIKSDDPTKGVPWALYIAAAFLGLVASTDMILRFLRSKHALRRTATLQTLRAFLIEGRLLARFSADAPWVRHRHRMQIRASLASWKRAVRRAERLGRSRGFTLEQIRREVDEARSFVDQLSWGE